MSRKITRLRGTSADLHVHTTHSDGVCSPGEVVRAAAAVGLAALAVTDHDTVTGITAARLEADRLGIELVNGIEVTADYRGREIHILGYFFRPDDTALLGVLDRLRRERAGRPLAIAELLTKRGLWVDYPALSGAFPRATLGRRHFASWLAQTGQVTDVRQAFTLYLGDEGPAYVAKPRLPWAEAVALIRGAGGVAAWAHPPYDLREASLRELAEGGLGAVEVVGPGTSARLTERWRSWADRLGLVPVCGSDFHAPDRPGRWVGSIQTPGADLERLRRAAARPPDPA